MIAPKDCGDMAELRVQIDALDRQLVDMVARRSQYIDRAIELKPSEGLPARIDDRVEQVVAGVRRHAQSVGLDADLVENMWRQMIEWSIIREEVVLGAEAPREAK